MSKPTMLFSVAFGTLVMFPGGASATEYPYCMTALYGWGGQVERCDYSTMQQCQMSASGLSGQCAPNWRIARDQVETPAYKRRR